MAHDVRCICINHLVSTNADKRGRVITRGSQVGKRGYAGIKEQGLLITKMICGERPPLVQVTGQRRKAKMDL